MSEPEISYRYFRDPHRYSSYSEVPRTCDMCGRMRAGYDGVFYGVEETDFVCEECLATGKLAERNLRANEGDINGLRQQLLSRHPDWPQERREAVVQERTTELEQRTPSLATWQDWFWPAHCGDYCRHIKEAGARDLITHAPDGDGGAFLAAHLTPELRLGYGEEGMRRMWESMKRFRSHEDESRWEDNSGIYLFECTLCGEYLIFRDFL